MGTNPNICFLSDMGRRSLVDSQGKKVGIFTFSKECFFGDVGWGGWKKGMGLFFCLL